MGIDLGMYRARIGLFNNYRCTAINHQFSLLRYIYPTSVQVCIRETTALNPNKPEFTIVIFVHYKPRIALAILDL